jgi:RNA polymerase sigma factor (sigma-70 family)
LALEGRAHLDQCLAILGRLRKKAHSEAWDGPIRHALVGASPAATAAWARAEQSWWTLAALTTPVAEREAHRHASGLMTTGLDVEDLRAAGVCGLYRAAQGWDPTGGASWATYAAAGAASQIRTTLRKGRSLSTTAQDTNLDLRKALADMERRGEVAYVPYAAEWLEIDTNDARFVLEAGVGPVRLDAQLPDDGARTIDALVDDEPIDPTDAIDASQRAVIVRRCLAQLTPRDRQILEQRALGATLQEIGDLLGLSGERIRQLDQLARARLRPLLVEALGLAPTEEDPCPTS